MKSICLDSGWTLRSGFLDSVSMLDADPGIPVSLPHDAMISSPVSPDAPARSDMGYFTGGLCNYTRYVFLPEEWKDECVFLCFDGAMMNASVDVNGCKAGAQHNGYFPFRVDLSGLAEFGAENRITVNLNTSMQPNSRWYTGAGLYRGVRLLHGPRLHIVPDGVFVYTREVEGGRAFLEARVELRNETGDNRLAEVELLLEEEKTGKPAARTKRVVQVNAGSAETARLSFTAADPLLWDADHPNLYRVRVRAVNLGRFRTRLEEDSDKTADEAETLFGIRTVTADPVHGLRINGKTVKLRGGCLHHDNGLLGAVSLYEAEARKVRKLKEVGFNAVRTAHNPPSPALVEACDREGMYIFDEAFDAWGMGKRGGDYGQFFAECWQRDLTAFVRRDRTHPSVILWSTGNEIPERGGLNNGYTLATQLAETVRRLDGTRPVSNGICSLWCGLDDKTARGMNQAQNAANPEREFLWERVTEPFTNGLDIVGYNYMEDLYERDHEMFPDRVMLGSENFPKEIGFRWPLVERLPYVLGDFTWTAWDYLGEAGIGKAVYLQPGDPQLEKGAWSLMPPTGSPFPWRTANDADFDITGSMMPQGAYRSVVWGSRNTFLFAYHPDTFGKTEMISPWGFPVLLASWSFPGSEGKPVTLVVYSGAQEVELTVNGKSLGRKPVSKDRPFPGSARFEAVYEPGTVEAVSYTGGAEVSRAVLKTAGTPARIRLLPEQEEMPADGHGLAYVRVEITDADGSLVPYAALPLSVRVSGPARLAGFGSGNPVTDEDYTDGETVSFRGSALAVLRSGEEAGEVTLRVSGASLPEASVTLAVTRTEES